MPDKKMGRPISQNPKTIRVDVRLTPKESQMLDEYCQKKSIARPQGLRDGLQALYKK